MSGLKVDGIILGNKGKARGIPDLGCGAISQVEQHGDLGKEGLQFIDA